MTIFDARTENNLNNPYEKDQSILALFTNGSQTTKFFV